MDSFRSFQILIPYTRKFIFLIGFATPRLPTACSCFLEPTQGYLARVRRSGANYLGDEQLTDLVQNSKLTRLHLKSGPRLKHTFPDSQTAWETGKKDVEEEREEEKIEKVEKVLHKSKLDNQIKGRQITRGKEKGEQNLFLIHSFLNSTLANFGDPLHKTERKG